MFWRIENGDYTTQGVGDFDDTKQYPLIVYVTTPGTYEISLNATENFDNPIDVYIYDALMDTYFDISSDTFQIALDTDTYINRFYVAFSSEAALSVPETAQDEHIISYFNSTQEIYVRTTTISDVDSVVLLNLLGQEIYKWDTTSEFEIDGAIRIPVKSISEGTYIIKVNTSNARYTNKIIIKK